VDALAADVYTELKRLAAGYVRRERANSVQATDLVHEAYLRLAIAAISMRRLLVERARARGAVKRGGANVQVTLNEGLLVAPDAHHEVDVLALDRALERLAALDPEQAKIVELRYFGGLSVEETGEALSISPATVKRHWTLARAWLLRELDPNRST
jgi:RNA polymerase sigma factor (TIGR02999 family)